MMKKKSKKKSSLLMTKKINLMLPPVIEKLFFLSYLFVKGEYQVVHVEEESTSVPQVEAVKQEEKIVELKEEE